MSLETALEMSLAQFSLSPGIGSAHPYKTFCLGIVDYFLYLFLVFLAAKISRTKSSGSAVGIVV